MTRFGSRTNRGFSGATFPGNGDGLGRPKHSSGTPARGLQLGDSSSGTPARGLQLGDSSSGDQVRVDGAAVLLDHSATDFTESISSDSNGRAPSYSLDFPAVWFLFAAGVLCLAAVAKLQWVFSNPLWEDMAVGGVWLTLFAILAEVWVALALLFWPARRQAAWLGVGTHAVLLVFGAGLWMVGQSCQCFGDWKIAGAEIPSWSLPLYNLIAITLFAWIAIQTARVGNMVLRKSWLRLPEFGTQMGIAVGLLLCLFLLTTTQGQTFWRPGAAVNEVMLKVGEVPVLEPGQSYETVVTLYNRLDQPIRVVGGGTTCTCVTLESIPLEIPARSGRELTIRFKVGDHLRGQKEFKNGMVYYLEGGQQFNVRGVVHGTIDNSR